ncbi:MAG: uroporphyrinogen-III synthase [Betaproteobacteria bacterium]|nr:uroporphyrinogen-III synthase [Betaproteobacteria bacterium]
MDAAKRLSGRHLVVTRPAAQAGHLAAEIERLGGHAVLFPVLEIQDVEDTQPLRDLAQRLDAVDLAVFVSPNAAHKALSVICAQRSWPEHLPVAVMGAGSAREVARFGIRNVIAPTQRHDSEALLELPQMQAMAGKRVVILRGDGGRELLGDTLTAHGAAVEFVTCYRRGKPDLDAAPLLQLWASRQLDAITVTSSEGLRNFFEMIGSAGQAALRNTPLFATHQRIIEAGRALGLQCLLPTAAGDEGLLAGMIDYFSALEK